MKYVFLIVVIFQPLKVQAGTGHIERYCCLTLNGTNLGGNCARIAWCDLHLTVDTKHVLYRGEAWLTSCACLIVTQSPAACY